MNSFDKQKAKNRYNKLLTLLENLIDSLAKTGPDNVDKTERSMHDYLEKRIDEDFKEFSKNQKALEEKMLNDAKNQIL
jgi:hypothetical protein